MGGREAHLELGRGTAGVFGAFLSGLWSAGEDMLRFWSATFLPSSAQGLLYGARVCKLPLVVACRLGTDARR